MLFPSFGIISKTDSDLKSKTKLKVNHMQYIYLIYELSYVCFPRHKKMYEYITFIKEVSDERSMMTVYWTKSLQYNNTFSYHNHNALDITIYILILHFYLF